MKPPFAIFRSMTRRSTAQGRSVTRSRAGRRALPLRGERRRQDNAVRSNQQQDAIERQRVEELEQELQTARDLQQGLLLEAVPRLPGWEIVAISLPARVLGGDLYDFLRFDDGVQGIMIGDVSGKGVPAALRMAIARTVFRYEARRGDGPATTLASVNRGVLCEIPQGMVTMLYARLDTASGLLHVANAGHTFPLLVAEQVRELEVSGLPLGVDGESMYAEGEITIGYGESVVLYTDGVLEAESEQSELFCFERLEALVVANAKLKPRALAACLLQELRAWSGRVQTDDITLVVLRRRLASLDAELRSVTNEVLGGDEQAQLFWAQALAAVGGADAGAAAWLAALPGLTRGTQELLGRGLARELQQQLRMVIEDYRV